MKRTSKLHVAVFPWLAMGHLIPFLRFSNLLAQKGHLVSFISTPGNLHRLPKIPPQLSSHISLISLPLPSVPGLPSNAETTTDVPYTKQQLLKKAFDLLESPLATFLETKKPDWVIYDYASHWLPSIASKVGISSAFFSLFTAATLSFIGPPSLTMNGGDLRLTAEDFTIVPRWVPFESNIKYCIHEVTKYIEKTEEDETGPNDTVRFAFASGGADVVIIRSSPEFEPEWFDLYSKMSEKPIIPLGFLPPLEVEEEDDDIDVKGWADIIEWLDKKEAESVVYVALGTEAALTRQEVRELALGLEKSRSPFIWVLKNPPGTTQNALEMLQDGYEERVKDRGMIYCGWVPQVKILSHESVGGFLTHCGWNSVVEGLSFGRVLILFPVLNDQGLNARLLHGKKIGLEVPRNESDGAFTSDSVAELVRKAKVDDPADLAKEMRNLFGDRDRNNRLAEGVVHYLEENRISRLKNTN
ncbi:UDP-glucosyltransferase, putative [Ricinus communis]|uniref:UDP-glucosyltransferase, putative n=1 Tax=Ricinus communis TaxID=3988 RepID=B9SN02_RICCO|nr:UDP-glucosyltransferase, putative [Ricinus communis]|eukprot:XP_002527371.1 UDP-glycosyltransferase 91C1 [Ricinus communis]